MTTLTQSMMQLWMEARTRFSNQLEQLTESDLKKRLGNSPNSVGYLLCHIADVELLFAKNVFGAAEVKIVAKTVIAQRDTGEWIYLQELKDHVTDAFEALQSIIEKQTDADWATLITTREFGTKTKAEALGRIVSHTAYHAGQLSLIKRYGTF